VVDDVEAQVEFLRVVFDANGEVEAGRPAEIEIGDARVMISPTTDRDRFPAFLYVYVTHADHTYHAGARRGRNVTRGAARLAVRWVSDPWGNIFHIAM
jgi:hypothetical protein